MRKAFYGGSFDPFTLGHLFVVCQALQSYDQVIIGIGKNSKKTSKFSADEKIEMIEKSITDLVSISEFFNGSVKVFPSVMMQMAEKISKNPDCIKIITYDGLTVDVAVKNNANVLIRGVRTTSDCDEETSLRYVNEAICKLRNVVCPTVIVDTSSTEISHISSTMVKNLMDAGEYIVAKGYVMPSVHDMMCKIYLRDVYYKITGTISSEYDYLCEKSKDGFQRFSVAACDLNMLNIYRTYNSTHDMSSSIYDLAIFWSLLIGMKSVDENAQKLVGHLVGDFKRFVELCEATNSMIYTDNRIKADKDADALSDICLNYFVYKENCYVNLWQRWYVAKANGLSKLDFLACSKDYIEKYIADENLFKTDFFQKKYWDIVVENMNQDVEVLDMLLEKHQTN